jgi:hypothetical protein
MLLELIQERDNEIEGMKQKVEEAEELNEMIEELTSDNVQKEAEIEELSVRIQEF